MNTTILGGSRRALSALVIAVVVAAGIAATAFASAKHTDSAKGQKPTIVLVHGGWADASCWNPEVTRLQQLGYPVLVPANPERGLASDADYIRSVLDTIKGPIVLVGHSYGGAVISNAAVGVPNVKALVYIAGFAPDKGESVFQLVTKNPGTMIGPKTLTERKYPLGDGKDGTDLYLTLKGYETAFAQDIPKKLAERLWAEQRPYSQAAFVSPSGEPAWKTIPSWYLVTTQDHAIPPATQMFMAHRAHAKIFTVKASHVPMLSQPAATTNVILAAAKTVG
jgi:pimeloyl-ACP methyl ester carboxylesterase